MQKEIQAEKIANFTMIVDESYLNRFCKEVHNNLCGPQETDVFFFLFRYFQTLLQQERLKEVALFLQAFEQYSFNDYNDNVQTFVNYIKAFLRKAQGETEEAAYWLRQTLVKHERLAFLGIKNVPVHCHKELGNLYFYEKKYQNAIDSYQSAVNSLSLDQDSEYLLAILMYNLSLCQYYLKSYEQTLDFLNKVIPLAKDTSNSCLLLDALILKAVLLTEHFKLYRDSNKHLDQAYEIAHRNQHTVSLNKIWHNWGHNFFYLKQYVQAEQALRHSIELSRKYGEIESGLSSKLLLAEIWIKNGCKQQSKQLLEYIKEKAANYQNVSILLRCLDLLEQVEDNKKLRRKHIAEAYRLACKYGNYQKSTKFKKKLLEN